DTACRLPFFFFFQAEDGIRDFHVTGVQTCALPICGKLVPFPSSPGSALKSPLLSPAGKARALAEPLVPRGTTADESVSSFLRRQIGRASCRERVEMPAVGGTARQKEVSDRETARRE